MDEREIMFALADKLLQALHETNTEVEKIDEKWLKSAKIEIIYDDPYLSWFKEYDERHG